MAYVIAITSSEGGTAYWQGGDVCGERGDEAARFMTETDADATIALFQTMNRMSGMAHAVELGSVL